MINEVNLRSGISKKDCRMCLEVILEVIKDVLKSGDSVTIANFGKFKVNELKSKNLYNFQTKATTRIDAKKSPVFKASDNLKEIIK